MPRSLPIAAVAVSMGLFVCTARASDAFLTIGGGYSPTGNQVSLEKNVLLFQRLLAERYSGGVSHDVFFSDGDDPQRDLQYEDPAVKLPRANLLVARVFRQTRHQTHQYRNHHIPGLKGPSTRARLGKWFDDVGRKLKKGDRLFVYVTAHGGGSRDKKNRYNTGLYLWNTDRLAMTDFAGMLDRVSPDVPVCLVMVQCYTAGFANILFDKGDAAKGLSKCNRCGFFATVHTRPAAGCTPDINEDNYREYSTYFWEAVRGRKRDGAPVSRPDYNGDGATTFDEAHAYALLTSSTIDISVKTSDRFLRIYSRTPQARSRSRRKTRGRRPPVAAPLPGRGLVSADSPFEQLLKRAAPTERAVLVGLSRQLKLKSARRKSEALKLAAKITRDKRSAESERRKKLREYGRLAAEIRKAVLNRWPELSNRWHARVDDILHREGKDLVKLIESHPKYKRFEALRKETDRLSTKSLDLERQWVKTQRLVRTLENVALAANLPKVASPEIVRRYHKLRKLESVALPAGPGGASKTSTRATP